MFSGHPARIPFGKVMIFCGGINSVRVLWEIWLVLGRETVLLWAELVMCNICCTHNPPLPDSLLLNDLTGELPTVIQLWHETGVPDTLDREGSAAKAHNMLHEQVIISSKAAGGLSQSTTYLMSSRQVICPCFFEYNPKAVLGISHMWKRHLPHLDDKPFSHLPLLPIATHLAQIENLPDHWDLFGRSLGSCNTEMSIGSELSAFSPFVRTEYLWQMDKIARLHGASLVSFRKFICVHLCSQ